MIKNIQPTSNRRTLLQHNKDYIKKRPQLASYLMVKDWKFFLRPGIKEGDVLAISIQNSTESSRLSIKQEKYIKAFKPARNK